MHCAMGNHDVFFEINYNSASHVSNSATTQWIETFNSLLLIDTNLVEILFESFGGLLMISIWCHSNVNVILINSES